MRKYGRNQHFQKLIHIVFEINKYHIYFEQPNRFR